MNSRNQDDARASYVRRFMQASHSRFITDRYARVWNACKKASVDKTHHEVIDTEIEKEIENINAIADFFKEKGDGTYTIDAKSQEAIMDVARSALEIYLLDTMEARAKSGIAGMHACIAHL